MKTRKFFMRAMAVALAVIMVVAAAVPAFAAEDDDLTITIKPHPDTMGPSLEGRSFYAYQIFKGTAARDPSKNVSDTPANERWGATSWNNWTLADIEWGSNINGSELLSALCHLSYNGTVMFPYKDDDETTKYAETTAGVAWPTFFANRENIFVKAQLNEVLSTAEDFANFLNGRNENAFLQELCAFIVLGKNRKLPSSKEDAKNEYEGFLRDASHNTSDLLGNSNYFTDPKSGTAEGPDDDVTITVGEPGYYLIVEAGEGQGIDAIVDSMYSEYMLAVLGNQVIYEKAQFPTVEKNIIDSGSGNEKGDAVSKGDIVTFELRGTLPAAQWDTFLTYDYSFNDTPSDNLDFIGITSVSVIKKGLTYTLDGGTTNSLGYAAYSLVDGVDEIAHTIEIKMHDLKQPLPVTAVSQGTVPQSITLDGTETIVVRYTAKLSDNSSIGNKSTENDAYIVYSNDPDSDTHGETSHKKVYLYTFGLNITKVGSTSLGQGLEGAGFVLYNEQQDKIAKFVKEEQMNSTVYILEGWVSKSEIQTKLDNLKTAIDKLNSNPDDEVSNLLYMGALSELSDYLIISNDQGNFMVNGIGDGTFYLEEVITPKGYNSLEKPIKVTIQATFWDYDGTYTDEQPFFKGQLKDVTYSFDGTIVEGENSTVTGIVTESYNYDAGKGTTHAAGGPWGDDGYFNHSLVNEKAPFLPFTGGVGTIVFYAAGGVLIVGALIYLVIASKKRKNRTDA